MSTLAACRADNFYRPNDYDPNNRKKEIEKKRGEGRLKVRKQGARKIRFEMPFHIRCTGCKKMIAKGVRFNSEKKKAGRYLGTIIFQFTMPCPNCKNTIIIKTDPKNCEYLLVSGCIKYNIDYEEKEIETIKIQTPEEGEQLNKNPFLKLETQKIDWIKGEEQKPILNKLIEEKEINRDDFYINQTLRRKLKMEKKLIKLHEEESRLKGLDMKLLPKNEHDKVLAGLANYKDRELNNSRFNIRDTLRIEPIFKNNKYASSNIPIRNEEIKNLLNKKHKLDRNLQFALEKKNISGSVSPYNSQISTNFSQNLKLNNITNIIIKKNKK